MTEKVLKNSSKRSDVFDGVWTEIADLLSFDPGLQAKTLIEMLMDRDESFHLGHLRTLQRRIREWRALNGPDVDVKFRQKHKPGKQSQSDWTHCEELKVTISGAALSTHVISFHVAIFSMGDSFYILFGELRQSGKRLHASHSRAGCSARGASHGQFNCSCYEPWKPSCFH